MLLDPAAVKQVAADPDLLGETRDKVLPGPYPVWEIQSK